MNYNSIIILGFKRSGTSLLRVLLNSHSALAVGPEIKFMQLAVKKYPKTFEEFKEISKREAEDFEFPEATVLKIFNESKSSDDLLRNWCIEYKDKTGKKIWGDKTPQNFKYLKLLGNKFPDSLYVHIVRNPFDVMISSKKRNQFMGLHTVLAWVISNYKVRYIKKENLIFFKYEDFVKNPTYYLDIILGRLGLQNENLLENYRKVYHGKIAKGDSWDKPITESTERNNKILSARDKLLIKFFCFPYLRKYGYK